MKKVKALLLTLLSLSVLGGAAGCELPDKIGDLFGNSSAENSSDASTDSSINDEESKDTADNSTDTSGNPSTPDDNTPEDEKPEISPFDGIEFSDAATVIPAAYALEQNKNLDGIYTLKGQIISSEGYTGEEDICVTIVVEGYEDYPLYCYYVKGADTQYLGLGDVIAVQGKIKNYQGTVEFDKPTLLAYEDGVLIPSIDVTPSAGSGLSEGYQIITVEQALAIAAVNSEPTAERYYIHATIDSILDAQYGEMTISDATGSISVYGTYSADGSIGYQEMDEKPLKGAEVLLSCTLNTHNGNPQVKNARLIAFKAVTLDESAYTEMNLADARTAEKGTLIKASGVVAQITYASGLVPNGFYLVDDTNSIYVYDGDIAAAVTAGNTVTVLAEKDWWILDDEQASAEKFGYQGCNQLTNAWLLANDNGNTEPNYSWVEESTVKAVMETPFTTDITTTVYKVTALVKKVASTGFINYYIDDLDGKTGSYIYTQANGNDLDWLEPFHNKICTVYLSVINAKSTASGCNWRFKALKVVDENFVFDTDTAGKFAVEYYGVSQFENTYTADPALELIPSVSSELLGFENATLSYESLNQDVVRFVEEDGKTVMHCVNYGTANIKITGTYNGISYSKTISITMEKSTEYDTITVAEAIASAVDSNVIVKGIVGPSVVNKDGFYLFGEDGSMIAVLLKNKEAFSTFSIGNEIILQGMRERYVKNDASAFAGQTCIVDGEILVNNQGNHAYSTEKFVMDKTAADFYALDASVDYSTTVFVFNATVKVEKTAYYTNLNIVDGDTTVGLYCSGAGQYAWLQEFADQTVTLEVAACNWNDKNYWRGCVLAVRLADGSKFLNQLNFNVS